MQENMRKLWKKNMEKKNDSTTRIWRIMKKKEIMQKY